MSEVITLIIHFIMLALLNLQQERASEDARIDTMYVGTVLMSDECYVAIL